MASFDITSEMDWQELDNAINQTMKEVPNRYDFRGIKVEIDVDRKQSLLTFSCGSDSKMDDFKDTFKTKLVKRGISLLAFDYQGQEGASGGSAREKAKISDGIEKDDAKKIVAEIKKAAFNKVKAQIQDDQVRVTAPKRDDLQKVISFLKEKQDSLGVAMQFGNYRD